MEGREGEGCLKINMRDFPSLITDSLLFLEFCGVLEYLMVMMILRLTELFAYYLRTKTYQGKHISTLRMRFENEIYYGNEVIAL